LQRCSSCVFFSFAALLPSPSSCVFFSRIVATQQRRRQRCCHRLLFLFSYCATVQRSATLQHSIAGQHGTTLQRSALRYDAAQCTMVRCNAVQHSIAYRSATLQRSRAERCSATEQSVTAH
jgi:hypothetical protein